MGSAHYSKLSFQEMPPGSPQKRRSWTKTAVSLLLLALCAVVSVLYHLPSLRHKCYDQTPLSVDERVKNILSKTPLIDGHNDLPWAIRLHYNNHLYTENFTVPFVEGTLEKTETDLFRLRKGMIGGAFWSVYATCPENGEDFSDVNYAPTVRDTLQQIDLVARLRQAHPDDFSPPVNSSTAMDAFNKGQLISPLGVEGLHQIGNSVANLRQFYELGARYATLTHNCHNKYADAALLENPLRPAEPLWGGVSPLGRRLIREMNRIGMMVDLSHVSEDTMVDVLGGRDGWDGSEAPIIFSHSSAYTLCPHPRNVKDHVLQLVKERNSIIMINLGLISPDKLDPNVPPESVHDFTLEKVAEHIIYVGNLIGYDHVGFGSDWDGLPYVPRGLEDVSKFPNLLAELLRRGVSDKDAAKIVGGNLLRVWRDVDATAQRLQARGEPVMEDDITS